VADPHILYAMLAVDAVALVLWVLYVLVRMPPLVPVQEGAGKEVGGGGDPQREAAAAGTASAAPAAEAKPAESAAAERESSERPKLRSYSDIQDDTDSKSGSTG
jgi:hypothetical protein